MFQLFRKRISMPSSDEAMPGRPDPITEPGRHFVYGRALDEPLQDGRQYALFGMGCFWGVERLFWRHSGVWVTSVGYAGGFTPNPTYTEVCSGLTGHNEVVRITFHPKYIDYRELLRVFWENHDPTQGMRQGNDIGTQYRSGIYTYDQEQENLARISFREYEKEIARVGLGDVTTEIRPAPEYYFAEEYHQQYLAKNPTGYCALAGTGVKLPADTFSLTN